MTKRYIIEDKLFGAKINFLFCSPKEYDIFMKGKITKTTDCDDYICRGRATHLLREIGDGKYASDSLFVLWVNSDTKVVPKDERLKVLVHECSHIVCFIFKEHREPVDDSKEAFAYFMGFLFQECYKKMLNLTKRKKKI